MNQLTLSWLSLLEAAGGEVAKAYSLKHLNRADLKTVRWSTFFRLGGGWLVLMPWVANFVFGVLTSVLLAIALRSLPTALTLAVWMVSSLLLVKLTDIIWLNAD